MGIILTEDDVVDIVASRDIQRILIEVKGGTTSIEGINSGTPFIRSQARTHISVAIFKVLQLKEINICL